MSVATSIATGYRCIRVDQIRPSALNPRKDFDEESLAELAQSMRENGLLQPVVVRPADEGFSLIAGERRWRAAQALGWEEIPAVVRDAENDQVARTLMLVENLQRRNLNPIEEAEAFKALYEGGMSQGDLASRIGRTQGFISTRIRLLSLPGPVREMVADGRLSPSFGAALLPWADDLARCCELARVAADPTSHITVRNLEAQAREDGRVKARGVAPFVEGEAGAKGAEAGAAVVPDVLDEDDTGDGFDPEELAEELFPRCYWCRKPRRPEEMGADRVCQECREQEAKRHASWEERNRRAEEKRQAEEPKRREEAHARADRARDLHLGVLEARRERGPIVQDDRAVAILVTEVLTGSARWRVVKAAESLGVAFDVEILENVWSHKPKVYEAIASLGAVTALELALTAHLLAEIEQMETYGRSAGAAQWYLGVEETAETGEEETP